MSDLGAVRAGTRLKFSRTFAQLAAAIRLRRVGVGQSSPTKAASPASGSSVRTRHQSSFQTALEGGGYETAFVCQFAATHIEAANVAREQDLNIASAYPGHVPDDSSRRIRLASLAPLRAP